MAGGHLRTSGRETAVDATLTIPHAGEAPGGLLHEGSVYVIMEINPTISNTLHYSVRCTPTIDPKLVRPAPLGPTIALSRLPTIPPPSGGGAGPVIRLPDLTVSRVDPATGVVVVKNAGDGPAAASELLLKILCLRDDGVAEKCGVGAVVTTRPFTAAYDRTLGGLIYVVPPLAAGGSHAITASDLSGFSWRPGKYELEATADVRNAVLERSEGNNVGRARFTKP